MSEKLVVRFSRFLGGNLCLFPSLFFFLSLSLEKREKEREGRGGP